MSWERFSRRDCPICQGTRNDCRQNTITTLIHCREMEAAPQDYIFRGYDSIGFGMWAEQAGVEAWTEERQQEWQDRKDQAQAQKQARLQRLLPNSERDLTIRSILDQLDLSEDHRQQLQGRGMSDQQIESGFYRTVTQWQKLPLRVDDRLAGVLRGGKGLYVPDSGILCPIPNSQGELVGWQLRLDHPGEFPKYLWASSEKKRRNNGSSAHLKNGELPLAYFAPTTQFHPVISKALKKHQSPIPLIPIALTEGLAFKPALTAHRLGVHSIGASGGHFASSPQTLHTYLEDIKAIEREHHQQEIALQPILFADAGCLTNENILHIYAKTIHQLQTWGYQPQIAWWEQVDKEKGDIDEIDPATLASLRLLSWSEFSSLVKKTERDRQIQTVQHQLQNLSYAPNLQLNTRYLPDLAKIIPSQGIIALKSPKGSGKSVQIQQIITSARNRGMPVISLTPRRALGREQSLKWGIDWGGDAELTGIHHLTLLENLKTLGICWDSLWKLMERDWSHTLVLIDEAELALLHLLLSSTCKEKRPLILRTLETKLRECLAHGGMLLIADADLTDLSLNYFQSLIPNIPIFMISNQYQGPETRWQVDFHQGKKDVVIAHLIADLATPVMEEGEERQRRIVIPTDSQDQAEALERFIAERFPHLLIVRIDSTTTETEAGRAFVERPNEKILEIQPSVLIYTPSMGAGVSIDVPWFDQMYGFFNGVIEPSQCRQMLGRVRAAIPRTIWCRHHGQIQGNASFLPEEIKAHLFSFHRQTNILIDVAKAIAPDNPTDWQIRQTYDAIWNPEKHAWDNPHVDLYCNLIARKNYGLRHLASELYRQLKDEGHFLIHEVDNDKTDEGLRVTQIKQQLPLEEAQAISSADDISLDLALFLKQKPNLSQQQRHQITKALLKAELPDVPLTPDFIHKAVTQNQRKWLNAQKLFWYAQHPKLIETIDRREWLHHLHQFSQGVVYFPDIRTYSLQVKVLRNIGLFRLIDLNCPEKEYSSDGAEIQSLLRQARQYASLIRTTFNLKVTKKTKPIQFLNLLLDRVGLHLQFHRQTAKGERFYRLDLDRFHDPDRLAVLHSLDQKWSELSSEHPVEPAPVEPTVAKAATIEEAPVEQAPVGGSQREPIYINNCFHCGSDDLSPEEPTEIPPEIGAEVELLTQDSNITPSTVLSGIQTILGFFRFPLAKFWLEKALEVEQTEWAAIQQYLARYAQGFSLP